MSDKKDFTLSSGNVFADIGLPNPEELQLKSKLTILIKRIINQRGWTQKQAAGALGIKQPDVSELVRGQRLEHYSVERLMGFLGKLEQNVTITISSKELAPQEIIVAASEPSKETRISGQR